MTARELPSYVDQNFRLRDTEGAGDFVLKISNSEEDPNVLEAQVAALQLLQSTPGHLKTPVVIPCSAGQSLTREGDHSVWLVGFLEGRLLSDLAEPTDDLWHELGRGLGDVDRRLAGFDPPAARRAHGWDLRHAPGVLEHTDQIKDPRGREYVRKSLGRFGAEVLPELERLPFQVIHNDANDHNVLVEGDGAAARACGLLDFGDLVWTARVCEAGIAATYAMLCATDPLAAGARVLAGYHETLALERAEIRLVPYLIEARLCVSVTMSSYRRTMDPRNEYLSVSEAAAWRILDWMSAIPPARWAETLEDACASVRPIGGNATPR